ncbi:MAG: nucleotidyltransferase domain-containing protein [Desulfuromonadales bacterium]|nr:MAG: nucleotidyltransferase domain-containing protein [Desulfuromonadales bacterium]
MRLSLRTLFDAECDLQLAILVGSQVNGSAGPHSDWDIAIQWLPGLDLLISLEKTETLRRSLAAVLDVAESRIDLIELPTARLAMRAVVAEEGVPLKGEDSLAWSHFLLRTWRDLEAYYWEVTHAA